MFTPSKVFFTKGVGIHKNRLTSFELALRDAGIEQCNLVTVSSILPPSAKIVPKDEGIKMLKSGQITFCVLAKNETCEPNRLINSAIGLAVPKDSHHYGYLSEHHGFGETGEKGGEYAEDLAATMLATMLGIEFDPNLAWEEREKVYKASGHIFKTSNICQSAEGNKNGLWTTVIAAAVFADYSVHEDFKIISPSTTAASAQNNLPQNSQNGNNQQIIQPLPSPQASQTSPQPSQPQNQQTQIPQ